MEKRKQTNNILGYFKKLKPTPELPELSESKVVDYVSDCNVESTTNNPDNVKSKVNDPDSVESPSDNLVNVPDINPMDIGLLIHQAVKINSNKRAELLMTIWKPDSTLKFPQSGNRNLKFQLSWLTRWSWLRERGKQKLGKLILEHFSNWKKAIEEFNKHENTNYHKILKMEIQHDRKKIQPIIKTIILRGRQGIALRGHRDSGLIDLQHNTNDGNFRALLRFRVEADDKELTDHLQNAPRNASYLSADVQNEIIDVCFDIILKQVVNRVNGARCFTVLADETTDIAGIEQFSLCARYLDTTKMIMREDFLKFVPVSNVTGKGLATTLLTTLEEIGINVKYLRGQGYDGAASMSGQFNGVQAHITKHYLLAHYIHCSFHSLNLAISDSIVRVCSSSTHNHLKLLCPTRWVDRHDSIIIFLELFDAIVDSLSEICTWLDKDASSGAYQLPCAIRQPEFILATFILGHVLSSSLPLSKFLQTKNIDLVEAVQTTDNVVNIIKQLRLNDESEFKIIFNKVKSKCDSLNIEISIPRTANKQKNRCNVQVDLPEDYYRISLFIPFIDHFLNQLNDQFLNHRSIIENFNYILPSSNSIHNEEKIKQLVEMYQGDLDCSVLAAVSEIKIWHQKFTATKDLPKNAIDALQKCNVSIFPSTFKLLQILATLPVTTASSERSFSTLKRLKTYLRNTTCENRLNGLAMMNIHSDIVIDLKQEDYA
ncbi:hypothetical protein AGLY_003378 [Aphis glycines]|uniref:HAT C-terminal dimerisation domain-containing protein n=1 Tax=Aphis glycines TaxID=307491 RepID=A0A6G0U0M0_APHGL|nr:hypothetical protein AGLY_003378 [Aphis glycines]